MSIHTDATPRSPASPGSATYRVEDRPSPGSMGIQRRIVGPRHVGPWAERGTTAQAWRKYKASRRQSQTAPRSATGANVEGGKQHE